MSKQLTPNDDRFCPVFNKVIDGELCYEANMCLSGLFKPSSVSELDSVKDIEGSRKLCSECKYNDTE